jgi:WD40 repeat protein
MAHATGAYTPRTRFPAKWAAIAAALLVFATIAALALANRGSAPPAPAAQTQSKIQNQESKIAGTITYEVTGSGLYTADASGAPIGTTTYDKLAHDGQVATAQDSVPSPDGKTVVTIERVTEGVFLSVTASGFTNRVAQLAGSSDPALVAGGKGAARAVEGVPLVVSWAPDSSRVAFGSITGEPYSLTVMRAGFGSSSAMQGYEVQRGYVGELAFSPDGKYLAVSTYALDRKTHTVLMLELATGRISRLIDGCHITWSPDSRYVAIHRDPGIEAGAWVVNATNAEDRWAISNEVQAFPLTWG